MVTVFRPQNLFIILAVLLLSVNTLHLIKEATRMRKIRKIKPYTYLGLKFSGLDDILHKEKYVGYYTDKDLDNRTDAMQFAQAQYILSPIILDLNNVDHTFILFDCSHPQIAIEKMKEINVIPVKINQFGVILARNLKPKTTLK